MLNFFKKKTVKDLIYNNELEKIRKRITPSDVNLVDQDGHTALYYAIQAHNAVVASFLLDINADLQLGSSDLDKPVILDVIRSFNTELLQLFLTKGELLPSEVDGIPLLHDCIQNNCRNYPFLDILIQNGCDPNQLNRSGRTVLAEALIQSHTDYRLVEFLLDKGTDIDRASDRVDTPLHCLIFNYGKPENEKVSLLKILLSHGRRLSEEEAATLLDHTVKEKQASLFLELLRNYPLIPFGRSEALQDFLTPLYFTPAKQKQLMSVLKEKNISLPVSMEILKAQGEAKQGMVLTPRMVFKLALNTSIPVEEKRTQLHSFFSSGEDINAPQDWNGRSLTSLQALVLDNARNPNVQKHAELLLSLGAQCDSNGQSALLFAARAHSGDLIETFLRHGADPLFVSEDGESLLSELINHSEGKNTLTFLADFRGILERIARLLSERQIHKLLDTNFKYGNEDGAISFINWALQQSGNDGLKLMKSLMQSPFSWNPDRSFDSEYCKGKPLLSHFIAIRNEELIEDLFKLYPDYKVPLGYGFFDWALIKNISLNNLKTIVDRTEDLSRKDTIQLDWEDYESQRFNYLVSLACNYDAQNNCDKEKYLEIGRYLFEKGVDPNQVGDWVTKGKKSAAWRTGSTFLAECVASNFMELFELGLQKGADPKVRMNANNDTLTLASCGRFKNRDGAPLIPFLEKMKEYGFSEVNTPNDIGKTPVLSASSICNYTILEWFIKEGGDVSVVSGFNNTTPVISAIVNWADISSDTRTKTVKILLDNGADVNQPDSAGVTPLMNAAYCGELSVVELLLKRGADVTLLDPKGWNALIHGVKGSCDYHYHKVDRMNEHIKSKILEMLAAKGADLNAVPFEDLPALSETISKGYKLLFSTLINRGASVNCADNNGMTPLMYALVWGHSDAVNTLLQKEEINLEATNTHGENLWHIAAYGRNSQDIVSVLDAMKQKKIKILRDKTGRHPLHLAVLTGKQKMIQFLLQQENCIDAVDNENNTPLMYTALSGNLDSRSRVEIAKLLLEWGADINAHNTAGNTVLKISQDANYQELSNLLLEKGADSKKGRRHIGFKT